ncbi:two-component system CheB/CheR fusion protein [Gillisia mitskevichiae]|uniref:Two-component system CheB/CheR fusion protein n=1 Tax=Gillisia mitskevichiae TaxID=270921 RepID=A0A495PK42_9FLAO|nr:chemotaxis protein CheB [Gillisia mitskevichiae]RKS50537.1 two-component system CheB/CheR fusion protein [Gillisia mitskevichiae]
MSEKPSELESMESRLIAVGASAGGLEALKSFFEGIPAKDTNSYIVIQHLSPDFKSMMGELLEKSTDLSIEEIEENTEISPGTIYLIPTSSNLIIQNGRLQLVDKPKGQKLNLPIDMFLQSLAQFKEDQAIAVILSGTGSDGTRGIKTIKEKGGLVMVQNPTQAKFDGMPQSAIQTGLVDYVLNTEDMGKELQKYINAPVVLHFTDDDIQYDEVTLSKILHLIHETIDVDFTEYKHSTLARRVARRVNVCQCSSLSEYYNILKSQPVEIPILAREFLIGVTKFFRDLPVWEIMEESVIPEIIAGKVNGEKLKIWDVACSTGEEAYSLAMYINEELERQNKKIEVKIFATDISQEHLDIGGLGIYSESIVADIDPALLQKYFITKSNGYQAVEKLRDMIIFSHHNIIKNPPFHNMDLVLCRNMLIYFQPSIQKRALNVLHYSLKENGFLVLGTSESINNHSDSFEAVNRKWKIYKNTLLRKSLNTEVLHSSANNRPREKSKARPISNTRPQVSSAVQKINNELNEAILEQFGGASIFIDSEYNILQAIGEFRKYASLPVNGFSINLLDMLSTDLKHIVKATVKAAVKKNKKVVYKDANYIHQEENKNLDLIVKPFKRHNLDHEVNYVLTFLEKDLELSQIDTVEKLTVDSRSQNYILELEEELRKTKEELQSSIMEVETSNEELQAANEELLASNEELQSTNEELQSVNEEINTVNAENIQKIDDLASLNADINNLLESTDIGTIFLDNELRIRKFTPAIKKHFSLINSDIGRPINNFNSNFGITKTKTLLEKCTEVLATGKTIVSNIKSLDDKSYLRRISVYKDSNDKSTGIVITFVDVESLEKAKRRVEVSEKRFKSFYEEDPIMHISVDPFTLNINQCNKQTLEKLGYESKEEIIGKPIFDLYEDEAQIQVLKLNRLFKERGELVNVEQEMITKDGVKLPIILNSTLEVDDEDTVVAYRFTCVDISALKKAQEDLKEQKSDLERVNKDLEQFVSICSHDLQEPLATIKFGSDILGKIYAEKLDDKAKEYISYIDEASDRLANQIKGLLEHSRIGRDSKKVMVDSKELMEVVKYDLGKRLKETKGKVYIGNLPKLMAYEIELRLLFQNLLSNALKYIAKDRVPEIRISAYPEGEHWIFSFMDNGIGISEEDQKNIFTIFNRVRTPEKYEGTGVGLAHVEKIVQLHEGNVWVDSQLGVGSTFYVKLKKA